MIEIFAKFSEAYASEASLRLKAEPNNNNAITDVIFLKNEARKSRLAAKATFSVT